MKKNGKRLCRQILMLVMVLGFFAGFGTTTQAAGEVSKEYWTDPEGLRSFVLDDKYFPIGRIRFGASGRNWAICGNDGGDLSLLSTSAFAKNAFGENYDYPKSNFIKDLEKSNSTYLGTKYFSAQELEKMRPVTVEYLYHSEEEDPYTSKSGPYIKKRVPDKKLYLPGTEDDNSYGDQTIYVGKNNDIPVSLARKVRKDKGFELDYNDSFWLRQSNILKYKTNIVNKPYATFWYMYVAKMDINAGMGDIRHAKCDNNTVSVVPAMNLNMDTVLFGSAVNAASSTYKGYRSNDTMEKNTYTLRYKSTSGGAADISEDGSEIHVYNAFYKYIVIQGEKGAYIIYTGNDGYQTITASEVNTMTAGAITNFKDCKVWIEYTYGRVTTAIPATQIIGTIPSASVTVAEPLAGAAPAAPTINPADSRYFIDYYKWYDISDGVVYGDGEEEPGPEVTGLFEEGRTYRLRVGMDTKDRYVFKKNAKVTINGKSPDDLFYQTDHGIAFYQDYTIPGTIPSVGINVTEPMEGRKPETPSEVGWAYKVDSYQWREMENGVEGEDIYRLSKPFVVEKTYRLKVTLRPRSDKYRFKTSYKTVMINGKPADKIVSQAVDKIEIYHDYTVPVLIGISNVDVFDITTPVAGQKPKFKGTLAADAHCHFASRKEIVDSGYYLGEDLYVNGITWMDSNGDYLTEDSIFVEGHEYQVQMILFPDSGYMFPISADSAINHDENLLYDRDNRGTDFFISSIFFEAEAAPKIMEVKISGVPTPVAGQSYFTDGITVSTVPEDAAEVMELYWYDETEDSRLLPKDIFQKGHKYHLCMILEPKIGHAFKFDNTSGEKYKPYEGTITINGKAARGEERFSDGTELFITGESVSPEASGSTTADAFTLTASVQGGHGTVEPAGTKKILKGETETILFKPDAGYEIDKVTVNGVETKVSGNTLPLKMDGNKTVVVIYKKTSQSNGAAVNYKVTNEGTNGKGAVTVTGSEGNKTELTSLSIPDTVTINGKPFTVTAIADNAFQDYVKLTTITIGKNVKTIGANAFRNCQALTKVTIGKGVQTIGANAFKNCKALTKVTIGNKVTTIGRSCFEGCSSLKLVIIGKNVKTIGKKAFKNCKKLTSIRFKGTKLKKVGANTFRGIHAKCKIKVPKSKLRAYKSLLAKKGQAKTVKISK